MSTFFLMILGIYWAQLGSLSAPSEVNWGYDNRNAQMERYIQDLSLTWLHQCWDTWDSLVSPCNVRDSFSTWNLQGHSRRIAVFLIWWLRVLKSVQTVATWLSYNLGSVHWWSLLLVKIEPIFWVRSLIVIRT